MTVIPASMGVSMGPGWMELQRILSGALAELPEDWKGSARGALQSAIVTDPARIPTEVRKDLAPIIGKYLP